MVVRICPEYNPVTLPRLQTEGACAHWIKAKFLSQPLHLFSGHHFAIAHSQHGQKGCKRFTKSDFQGVSTKGFETLNLFVLPVPIRRRPLNLFEETQRACLLPWVKNAGERIDEIVSFYEPAVVEPGIFAESKGVG